MDVVCDVKVLSMENDRWVRFLVPGDMSFFDFHRLIVKTFGLPKVCSHRFIIDFLGERVEIGPEVGGPLMPLNWMDERKVSFKDLAGFGGSFVYVHDLLEERKHSVDILRFLDLPLDHPIIVDSNF